MVRTKYPEPNRPMVRRGKKPGPKLAMDTNPDFLRQVEYLSKLGATNEQLAGFFRVQLDTVNKWLKNYPKFREVRKRGGMEADMLVAESLYRKAIGYEVTETVTERRLNKETEEYEMVLTKEITKHIQPDTTSIIFWLKNRQRDIWNDVHHIQHSGTIKHKMVEDIPMDQFEEDELDVLFRIGMKQLDESSRN